MSATKPQPPTELIGNNSFDPVRPARDGGIPETEQEEFDQAEIESEEFADVQTESVEGDSQCGPAFNDQGFGRPAAGSEASGCPAETSPEPEESIADRMVSHIKDVEVAREKSQQFQEEELWGLYRKTMLATTPPTEPDLDRLVDVCAALGISTDQVRRDLGIIARARRNEGLHARREEYNKASVEKRETRKRIERENKERLLKARREEGHCDHLVRQSIFARDELRELAKRAPQLFDCSTHPPRLLSAEPERPSSEPASE